jgi:hypothetical protein
VRTNTPLYFLRILDYGTLRAGVAKK